MHTQLELGTGAGQNELRLSAQWNKQPPKNYIIANVLTSGKNSNSGYV